MKASVCDAIYYGGGADRSPDWAPDKLSSFEPNLAAVIALAPRLRARARTLLRLLLRSCQFSQCLFSFPYLRVEGYKLEATPLMIQRGPRLRSIILVSAGLIRYLRSPSFFPTYRSLSIYEPRHFDSCHSDCSALLIVR